MSRGHIPGKRGAYTELSERMGQEVRFRESGGRRLRQGEKRWRDCLRGRCREERWADSRG